MQGGIIDKDMPIDASNVAILCSECGPTRVGYRIRGRRQGPRLPQVREGALMATATEPAPKAALRGRVQPALQQELGLGNVMQVPRLEKIVLNCGVGAATQQQSLLDGAVADLTVITGQKPLVTQAKKSIAGFKLRDGNPIGAKVTLRGDRMWEFYDRLVSLAIPRIRDFRGMNPTRSTAVATTRSASPSS